jgi:hypothetical protein
VIPAALALAASAGAGHDTTTVYDPAGVLHLNVVNDENPDGSTKRLCTSTTSAPCFEAETDNASALVGRQTGTGPHAAVRGLTYSMFMGAAGVLGGAVSAQAGSGTAGVRGANSGTGYGVWGQTSSTGEGVFGTSPQGAGVHGRHTNSSVAFGGTNGGYSAGVFGDTSATTNGAAGVWGQTYGGTGTVGVIGLSPSGVGVAGVADLGGQVGVLGFAHPPGLAGLFHGDVHVQGTLSKSAGAFRIDHPLDPAHKYLQHSFVESPQMKNVYDGLVRTNERGFATVRLPAYFQALNRDFRYQLTVHGRSFAQALVCREIANNRFTIRTNRPGVKVSWQVTGIRRDVYANAHRIQPELAKPSDERGLYLYPELYGKPRSQSILPVPAAVRQAYAARG